MIQDLVDKLSETLPPVTPDQLVNWRRDPVTQHLYNDLFKAWLDLMVEPMIPHSTDYVALETARREGCRQFVDKVMEWTPAGYEEEEPEDGE